MARRQVLGLVDEDGVEGRPDRLPAAAPVGATVLEASGVVRRVTDHTYRRAVHSVIQVLDHGPFIDVWVQHAESCRGRVYPSLAREQTMEYFFESRGKERVAHVVFANGTHAGGQ